MIFLVGLMLYLLAGLFLTWGTVSVSEDELNTVQCLISIVIAPAYITYCILTKKKREEKHDEDYKS